MHQTEQKRTIRYVAETDLSRFRTKRVAVYARISSAGEMKHHSIVMQEESLRNDIENHPGWQCVGCYIDEGVTGTKLNRPALDRLMADARAGKIDIITTKTVSRLGRNASAVQVILQELKELGVIVIFENDHISTDNPESSFYLQYLGIQAEAEAKQNSDYQRWSTRNRFKQGIPSYNRLYGYQMKNHQLIIIPKEAEVVKRIFKMYLEGMGKIKIAKLLNQEGIKTINGGSWSQSSIHDILHNEKYTGDMILQKWHTTNYLTKAHKRNYGEIPRYLLEGTHEAIISKETYEKVQQETARRNTLHLRPSPTVSSNRPFYHLLICSHCGKYFNYKYRKNNGYPREIWTCDKHLQQGVNACPIKPIREDILLETTKNVLQQKKLIRSDDTLTNELIRKHLGRIIVGDDHTLKYQFLDGTTTTKTWQYQSRSRSWTPEMRQKARERALEQHRKKRASTRNDESEVRNE